METEVTQGPQISPPDTVMLRSEMIEMIEATEGYASDDDYKINLYVPNKVANLYHASQANTRFIFGGNRSGKSETMLADLCMELTARIPLSLINIVPASFIVGRKHMRLVCLDYPNGFEKIALPKLLKYIPQEDIQSIVKEQGRIRGFILYNGNTLEIMSNDQDVMKHGGTSRHRIDFDEEPDKDIWDENLMRIIDVKGRLNCAMTPINGMSWSYDDIFLKAGKFVDVNGGRTNPEGDSNIEVFKLSIFGNRIISHDMAKMILDRYPAEERQMRAEGDFIAFSGMVYKGYNDDTHIFRDEITWWRPSGSHKIGGGKTYDYSLYVAIDPHPRTPHAVLFLIVDRKGNKYLIDELYMEGTTQQLAIAIRAKCRSRVPAMTIIDPFAHSPDPLTGTTFAIDMAQKGVDTVGASKDKARGIIRVQEALAKHGQPPRPELCVHSSLKRVRYEFARYCWDDYRKALKSTKGEKQKPVDKDDHMMENLYRLMLLEPKWVDESDLVYNEYEEPMSYVGH